MGYGPIKVFSGNILSGASTLTSLQLDKSYSTVYAEIGTMSTAAALDIYVSSDGSTFRPAFERVNTATVQYQTMIVATSVGANGGICAIEKVYPYYQFRASAVVSGGVAIKLICVD